MLAKLTVVTLILLYKHGPVLSIHSPLLFYSIIPDSKRKGKSDKHQAHLHLAKNLLKSLKYVSLDI